MKKIILIVVMALFSVSLAAQTEMEKPIHKFAADSTEYTVDEGYVNTQATYFDVKKDVTVYTRKELDMSKKQFQAYQDNFNNVMVSEYNTATKSFKSDNHPIIVLLTLGYIYANISNQSTEQQDSQNEALKTFLTSETATAKADYESYKKSFKSKFLYYYSKKLKTAAPEEVDYSAVVKDIDDKIKLLIVKAPAEKTKRPIVKPEVGKKEKRGKERSIKEPKEKKKVKKLKEEKAALEAELETIKGEKKELSDQVDLLNASSEEQDGKILEKEDDKAKALKEKDEIVKRYEEKVKELADYKKQIEEAEAAEKIEEQKIADQQKAEMDELKKLVPAKEMAKYEKAKAEAEAAAAKAKAEAEAAAAKAKAEAEAAAAKAKAEAEAKAKAEAEAKAKAEAEAKAKAEQDLKDKLYNDYLLEKQKNSTGNPDSGKTPDAGKTTDGNTESSSNDKVTIKYAAGKVVNMNIKGLEYPLPTFGTVGECQTYSNQLDLASEGYPTFEVKICGDEITVKIAGKDVDPANISVEGK